jgi:hypothetical protein
LVGCNVLGSGTSVFPVVPVVLALLRLHPSYLWSTLLAVAGSSWWLWTTAGVTGLALPRSLVVGLGAPAFAAYSLGVWSAGGVALEHLPAGGAGHAVRRHRFFSRECGSPEPGDSGLPNPRGSVAGCFYWLQRPPLSGWVGVPSLPAAGLAVASSMLRPLVLPGVVVVSEVPVFVWVDGLVTPGAEDVARCDEWCPPCSELAVCPAVVGHQVRCRSNHISA